MIFTRALPYASAQFFIVAFQWMSMLYLPIYFREAGLSETMVGVNVSLFSLSTLLLVLPLGVLSDRIAPRPMLIAGALLVMASAAVLWLAEGKAGMAIGTFIAGSGFTLSSISLFSLFFKQVGSERRGSEVSVFNIGGILGAGVGAWSCGELGRVMGSGAVFPLAAVFAVSWAGITLLLPAIKGIQFPIIEYKEDLKRGRTWVLIAVMFVGASHAGFEHAGYSLLQTEVIGLKNETVGRIFMALSIWMCIVTFWTGSRHDKVERPVIMMGAGLILSGIFMAASGAATGVWDFFIYRALHTAGDSITNLLTLVIASLIFARHRFGGAFAFALTVNTSSYFLFANVGGVVGEVFGIDRSFYLSGGIEAAAGLLILILLPRLRSIFEMHANSDS